MLSMCILLVVLCVQPSMGNINCGEDVSSCKQCMAKGPPCLWCFDPEFKNRNQGTGHRCGKMSELLDRGCSKDQIMQTKSELSVVKNDPPTETSNTTIQLYPQEMKIKLRPNEPVTVTINYQQAQNYPVDLYYLTDMSFSMYKHLAVVSQQAQVIEKTMKNLTTKFRMGFGTFVDKPVLPFVDTRSSAMENPCVGVSSTVKCDTPYGYRHVLSLTSDIKKFQKVTNSTRPSGSLDSPEGGLDALAQAALCDETIGWQPLSRKIILFTTDAGFHIAGDGRLGGLIKRFEEKCFMRKLSDGTSIYDKSAVFDYPSVGQVARTLESKGIGVIFAITKNLHQLYLNFANILPPATVGILEGDSDNIASLVRENYDHISSSIALNAHYPTDKLKVKITSVCPNTTKSKSSTRDILRGESTCHGLPLGGRAKFKVEVVASTCLETPVNITLKPTNLEGEIVVLTVQSSCSCEGNCGKTVMDSPKCSDGRGNMTCGSCVCQKGFSGDFCECTTGVTTDTKNCVNMNGTSPQICSGRGRCECGSCRCNSERYSGAYCECDLRDCPRAQDDGSVCGGPTRGSCNCNKKCSCKPGYKGDACDCLIDKSFCRGNGTLSERRSANSTLIDDSSSSNSSDVLCNGRGTCDCGLCVCNDEWTGLTCTEPRGGEGRLCQQQDIQECVLCLLAKYLNDDNVMHTGCSCTSSIVDEKLVSFVDEHNKKVIPNLCVVYDQSDCRVYFTYSWEAVTRQERRLVISVQSRRECPDRTNIILIVAAVILLIVIIGILLLVLWKLFVTIQDRRAQADTLKVADQAHFEAGENPIYRPPITTVRNPLCESPKVT